MGRRILNDALRSMVNVEKRGKALVELPPISNMVSSFLKIMKDRAWVSCFLAPSPLSFAAFLSGFLVKWKNFPSIALPPLLFLPLCEEWALLVGTYGERIYYYKGSKVDKLEKFIRYVKSFQVHDPHRVGRITVELQGRIKDCKALTYRQDIRARDIEQYRVKMLPTHQWGYVVITTPDGVLDHEEAIRRNVGGQVIGYFH
ncbi:hypothetical protein NL676_003972 [Syzygium grande]|nr:hypothetical protein NL676_003972 [Syzygium grande]